MPEAAAPDSGTAAGPVTGAGRDRVPASVARGTQAEATLLKSFGEDGFHLAEIEAQDISRMAELPHTERVVSAD